MHRLAKWNDEYLNPILQRDPSSSPDSQLLKLWQDINLADAQTIVMNQTKISVTAEQTDTDDKALSMIRMLLPGDVAEKEKMDREMRNTKIQMEHSERLTEEYTVNNLRDNLYASRKQMELQGHIKYRKINNVDRKSLSIKQQQQELVLRQRMKSFAARTSLSNSSLGSSGHRSQSGRRNSSGGRRRSSVSRKIEEARARQLQSVSEEAPVFEDKTKDDPYPWHRADQTEAQRSFKVTVLN